MANEFNLKKDLEVYLYDSTAAAGSQYLKLDVSEDVNFSQTFANSSYTTKTIHSQHLLHQTPNIKRANPANFSFTIPLLQENDLRVVFDRLVKFKTSTSTLQDFDLFFRYPVGDDDIFKIETCVITEGLFVINQAQPLLLSVSGEGTKLTRLDSSGRTAFATALGNNLATRSTTRTFQSLNFLELFYNSQTWPRNVSAISLELQNDIEWTKNNTVHTGIATTDHASTLYPSTFTLKERKLGGSVTLYVDAELGSAINEGNNLPQTWKQFAVSPAAGDSEAFRIKAGAVSDFSKGIKFVVPDHEITFTDRVTPEQVMIHNFDFSFTPVTSTNLDNILTYN